MSKRRIHDGIVGLVVTLGVALGYLVDPLWHLLPGVIGITLIQSMLTGFCPVYFMLDRVCPAEQQASQASETSHSGGSV